MILRPRTFGSASITARPESLAQHDYLIFSPFLVLTGREAAAELRRDTQDMKESGGRLDGR